MKKILIAYDGSEPARRALRTGAELARRYGSEVGVVGVAGDAAGKRPDDPKGPASARAADLYDARRQLAKLGITATTHQLSGPAGPRIVAVAEEFGYDTIVVGPRGMGFLGRALLGSVSEYVANHATVTVVVAR